MSQAERDPKPDPAKNISLTVNQHADKIEGGGNLAVVLVQDSTVDLQVERIRSLHQLPAPPADFTGRVDELRGVQSRWDADCDCELGHDRTGLSGTH